MVEGRVLLNPSNYVGVLLLFLEEGRRKKSSEEETASFMQRSKSFT
jgi:hypothetical protein